MRGILAVVLLVPTTALAEIAMGESVEWLTVSRPHIAIVVVEATRGTGSKGRVVKVLKGAPPADPTFRDRGVVEGNPLLVFFDAKKAPEVVYDLAAPATDYRAALGMDMAVLDTREKILGAVEARLKRGGSGVPAKSVFQPEHGFVNLEIPPDTGAYRALWSGSACYLAVPADPEVKTKLVAEIRTSKHPWDRAHATRKLSAFPGDETVALLRSLLSDPAVEIVERSDGKTTEKVPVPLVRQAAWDALKELGVEVPKPKGYRDDMPVR